MKSDPANPVVVLMLKAPRVGTVKTRLAAEIGAANAALVYHELVKQQLGQLPREWRTEIHFSPDDAAEEMRRWLGASYPHFPQGGGDLGSRLERAVSGAFERGAPSVLVIGADCPSLDESCLRRAAQVVRSADVVLGPARDGGYYLIALQRSIPRLFEQIPWSTKEVLAITLQRIAESKLDHVLLETKEDLDDLAGLRRIVDSRAFGSAELLARFASSAPL